MRLKFYYKIDLRRNVSVRAETSWYEFKINGRFGASRKVREPKSLDTRRRLEGISYVYTSNYTVLILLKTNSRSLHKKKNR